MNNTIKTIIYSNLVPLMSCFFLLALASYHPTQNKKQTRTFQVATMIEICMIIIISCDFIFTRSDIPNIYLLRRITSFCNFAMSPFIPLLLYKIFHPQPSKRWLYLPIAVNFILCFISMFNGVVFEIGVSNSYGRGDMFLIPFTTMVFYMIILIFHKDYQYRQNKKIERILLLASVLLCILGMVLEIVFAFSFMTWDISALCLFSYYLLLCIHSAVLDPLTGAFNRVKYNKMLTTYEHRKSFVIAMLDINDFKMVNDTQGHEAGDQFLIEFVNLLERYLNKDATIYRVGGDEFILLTRKVNEDILQKKILSMKQIANQKNIDFAYGICTYHPKDELTTILELVDKNMYYDKAMSKQKP